MKTDASLLFSKMLSSGKVEMLAFFLACLTLPVFIRAASIASADDTCPVSNTHCVCSEGPFYIIQCKNITDLTTLQDVVGNFSEKTFIFELGLVNWSTFPRQALESPFLMSMALINSTFNRLVNTSDLNDSYDTSILHHLSLENVTLTEEWTWDQLSIFKKLDILFAYNTTIGDTIPSNFSQHVSKSLKFLSISQSNVSHVEPGSFEQLRNLTYLRISHSKLQGLYRQILPNPSSLGQLRLDHNSIKILTADFFEGMPNLTVVSLSNNRLALLDETLFRPIWKPNVHIELRNNPIKCDCRMKWIVETPTKPDIIGECAYPKRLFGRELSSLTEADFPCSIRERTEQAHGS